MKTRLIFFAGAAIAAAALGASAWQAPKQAPALIGEKWTKPPKRAGYSAPLTLVHFYTFGCINCKHNLPVYNRWFDRFSGRGLQVLGVHTPETRGEHDWAEVRAEAARKGIKYPVLQDNDEKNWNAWGVQAWPSAYLVDSKGKVRAFWEGEFGSSEADWTAQIDHLLKEAGK